MKFADKAGADAALSACPDCALRLALGWHGDAPCQVCRRAVRNYRRRLKRWLARKKR